MKILKILTVLSVITLFIPHAQAGTSASKSYKLSVTIPESVQQKQDNPQALLPSNSTNGQAVSLSSSSQGFQLVEAVRNNQKIVLVTYVVQ